jgi:hypothetical protein
MVSIGRLLHEPSLAKHSQERFCLPESSTTIEEQTSRDFRFRALSATSLVEVSSGRNTSLHQLPCRGYTHRSGRQGRLHTGPVISQVESSDRYLLSTLMLSTPGTFQDSSAPGPHGFRWRKSRLSRSREERCREMGLQWRFIFERWRRRLKRLKSAFRL